MCNSSKFTLKFCSTRWTKNVSVAGMAIEVFDDVKKFFENSKLPKTITSSRFDFTTRDSYFTILVEVFTNHVLAEKTFHKSY